MKLKLVLLILCTVGNILHALPLSRQARQEAALFNNFLQATYAQRTGHPQRFALLRKALKQAPDSAYLKQQLVAESLAVDALELADLYANFIDDDSEDPEAWVVYGAYQWRKENVSKALESYEKALSLDPDDERILLQYVTLLATLDPQKAAQTLEEVALSRPPLAPEIYTEIGRIYFYHQQYSLSLEAFDKAIVLDPSASQPRLGRASVYEKTNQYFLMLHELEELEKMGYLTAQTASQMGSVFILVKDFPKAQEYFQKAKNLENGHIAAGYFLALLAEQQGDFSRAIAFLKETDDYAVSPTKQIQVSYYQRKLNQDEESFKTISRAYKIFNDNAEVAYLYAVALYERKAYRKSARVLAPFVEKYPTNADIRLQYAFALEGQKKYRAMEKQLRLLLEQNPRNAPALNLYAYSLALRGERLDEAAEYIARALAIWPDDNSFMDTQAWIFYKQGKCEQAADIIRGIDPTLLEANPEMAYHAGMIYAATNQPEQAKKYLQLAANGGWKAAKKELKRLR